MGIEWAIYLLFQNIKWYQEGFDLLQVDEVQLDRSERSRNLGQIIQDDIYVEGRWHHDRPGLQCDFFNRPDGWWGREYEWTCYHWWEFVCRLAVCAGSLRVFRKVNWKGETSIQFEEIELLRCWDSEWKVAKSHRWGQGNVSSLSLPAGTWTWQ